MLCSNCGRAGHVAENCFKLIGFPDWWGDRPRNRAGRGRGHTAPMHTGDRSNIPAARANATTVVANSALVSVPSPVIEGDKQFVSGITEEQWKSLMTMVNANRFDIPDPMTDSFN
ncbi:PREDICTED: uncharacterized protein LOC104819828 isoform X2 [Tarenaya hassleriana]|uniref:uncharacterized protein LOC104819828 isoform X2 n=1 Tax=Tarenaya hassleriana TaxID=28532 RepID=UPI00053C19D6|nr:PREDICTED: uncharacterized protein LOC104819828 isoform X2 [Tarenaya hassleriana]